MTYKQFSTIWDIYIPSETKWICEPATMKALIEYGQGNKTKFKEIREFLGTNLPI
jgi:hypothetical protein